MGYLEDINDCIKQDNISQMLAEMMALISNSEEKATAMKNQRWYQRMIKTVFGKNKVTVNEIKENTAKLTAYMSMSIAELYRRDMIDKKMTVVLGDRINELIKENNESKELLRDISNELNLKMDSIDSYHMLMEEIRDDKFGNDPILASYQIIALIGSRMLNDERKREDIVRSLKNKGIISGNQYTLTDLLTKLTCLNDDQSSILYMSLQSAENEFFVRCICHFIEQYNFESESKKQFVIVNKIIENILSEEEAHDAEVTTIGYFESILEAKKNAISIRNGNTDNMKCLEVDEEIEHPFGDVETVNKSYLNPVLGNRVELSNLLALSIYNMDVQVRCITDTFVVVTDKSFVYKINKNTSEKQKIYGFNSNHTYLGFVGQGDLLFFSHGDNILFCDLINSDTCEKIFQIPENYLRLNKNDNKSKNKKYAIKEIAYVHNCLLFILQAGEYASYDILTSLDLENMSYGILSKYSEDSYIKAMKTYKDNIYIIRNFSDKTMQLYLVNPKFKLEIPVAENIDLLYSQLDSAPALTLNDFTIFDNRGILLFSKSAFLTNKTSEYIVYVVDDITDNSVTVKSIKQSSVNGESVMKGITLYHNGLIYVQYGGKYPLVCRNVFTGNKTVIVNSHGGKSGYDGNLSERAFQFFSQTTIKALNGLDLGHYARNYTLIDHWIFTNPEGAPQNRLPLDIDSFLT